MTVVYRREERVAGWESIRAGHTATYWDGNKVRHGLIEATHIGWKHQWVRVHGCRVWIDERTRQLPRARRVVLRVTTEDENA